MALEENVLLTISFQLLFIGHEAFSSLVDVAVQQPLLPVPHKDDKRPNVPVSEPAQHHEIRYHPHTIGINQLANSSFHKVEIHYLTHSSLRIAAAAHEQMAMIHQQQLRAEIQRRHQQQIQQVSLSFNTTKMSEN